ncbi:MAG: 4Fe-4S binding protein [Deltaproteobacteria bacterium]|nr:4Fe-4S binding protein [Deltaproteobacteria bacterium]
MKWEKDARELVESIPVHDIIKNLIIIWAEKVARKNKRDAVSMKEMQQTRDDYFEWFGPEKIAKIQQAREGGRSDDDLDPQTALNKAPALYTIELCHSRFFGCDRDLINVRELGPKIKQKMEELKITEILADKACEVLMPHSTFTISISGCSNICTAAESKEVGIHGAGRPKITDKECSQCESCVKTCLDRIITIKDDRPVINEDYCKVCGDCIRVCPTGTLAAAEMGCRIMVGGTFGRFAQYGKELYKITDTNKIDPILEACVDLIKKEWDEDHEDHFSFVINRTGISPIFEHLRNVGKL